DEWNEVKKHIEKEKNKIVKKQKIYWIKIGKNIGSEIFGKGRVFARPVLVINVFYNGLFLGVPLSSKTKNKSGKLYYKFTDEKGNSQVALLGQMKIFDNKRKITFESNVKNEDFILIKEKIKKNIID
ncbi:type II toxin-antitoxin system PemK/MazF family toxin, partial [Campylobacter jejuni]|nr:type II toxin-antitoxin system PemK/MazF family toxin [Campylobacter jejuni]